jgi:hypothetical protein
MAHVRAVGLLVLLSAVPAAAESVTIELTPQGMLWLWLHAADRAMAESLGTALGRSLGCTLSGVTESPSGSEWVFHAHCPDVFQRRGQVLEGQLKLGAFRQALTKASIREIRIDVIVPDAPYSRSAFGPAWNRISRKGLVYHSGTMAPRELPARAIHLAMGYRTSDLVLIFGPLPYSLLLTVLLLMRLNGAAKKARQMDPRALWFAYRRALAWGMTAIFLVGAALWTAMSGALGGDTNLWIAYCMWHGVGGQYGMPLALLFYSCPALLMTVLSVWWTPRVFATLRDPRRRLRDTMKLFLLPALGLIVPAYWTIAAVGALVNRDFWHVFLWSGFAASMGVCFRLAVGRGYAKRASTLESGEVYDRLVTLAPRCGVVFSEVRVAPISAAVTTDPVVLAGGRVVLSELALETMEPAEIEAAVARRWSLPMRDWADLRSVLLFFVALCIGMALSMAIVFGLGLLRLPIPRIVLTRLSLLMAVGWAVILGWWIHGWLVRLADRRAAVLVGSPEVVNSAADKLAAMQLAPWKWDRAMALPLVHTVAAPPADAEARPATARSFSAAWRRRMGIAQGGVALLTISIPPIAVAVAVRGGAIPAAVRWPAYLAGMALSLLLRPAFSKAVSYWYYRGLRSKIGASMQMAESGGVIFVGLSPEPRELLYDGFSDWDDGFMTLSADRLDYQGERVQFTLRREQVSDVHIGKGSPHSDDPLWVYLSWRDAESGREGTFPLILPRVRSPWRHAAEVRKLYRALLAWKNGAAQPAVDENRPEWGLPVFPVGAGTPLPNPFPTAAAMIAVFSIAMSFVAHFPIASEATLYFALVWMASVLWDLFGHRFAAPVETAEA